MRPSSAASAASLPGYVASIARSLLSRRASKPVRRSALLAVALVLAAAASLAGSGSIHGVAATGNSAFPDLPVGFAKVELATGLKNPTAMAFAPNGDIYITQQRGAIRLFRGGTLQAAPVVTLNTDNLTETGVLGLALDPNFATNGYMYVAYTTPDEHSQLSRFTVTGGGTTASLTSEVVYMRGNQLQAAHHAVNDVHIGPDGKLWVSVGDNDPAITNGAVLTNVYGKILRFNLDGTVPSDNPFLSVPGAVPSIYAYGLRNPFRFTFLPNGKAMTEDTGSSYWEELDTIQPGGNYGWDFYEGNCFSCGYINPTYAYGHLPTDSAASALAAYSGNVFPAQYAHTVFFGDYNRHDIEAVTFDPTYSAETSQTVFDSSVGTIADLQEGPDGDLYYVSIYEGQFWKIYPTGPFAPTAAASANPNAGLAPLATQFSSVGSGDPYNLPLTYSWDFGDGSPASTNPNPSHSYGSVGTYTATLTVSNGSSIGSATTQVVVGSSPPAATMLSPTIGTTYNGGSAISFSGVATDALDGAEPGSAFSWRVDFISAGVVQPFYTYEAPGPFYSTSGVTSGSFQIPTDVSNTPSTFYRLTMTATDSLGLTTTVTRDIHPNLTGWTVGSNVAGSLVFVDGTLQRTPYTTSDVVGIQHVLMGLPEQVVGGTRYRLNGWADGSAMSDTFASGAAPATFSTSLDPVSSVLPAGWTSVDVGGPLMTGTAEYSAGDQAFYIDGSGSDVYGTKDQFHYVYQTLNGDGTIVARVRYQSNTSPWAKAGVMFKQSPIAGASFVDALVTPDVSPNTPNFNGVACTVNGCAAPLPPSIPTVGYGVREQYSPTGSNQPATALAGYASPNKWLKLQRVGNTFSAWQSNDGVTWNSIGHQTLTMATSATVGLFVTSHNVGQLSSVGFDNVSVTGSVVLPPNDFSIAAGPATVSIAAGASGSTGIGTTLVSGSAETIALSASGLPAGVTAGFLPMSVTAGGSSTFTLSVGSAVAPGSYPITVTGVAPSATHATSVTLNVAAPPPNDFSIVANPSTVPVAAGASGATSIGTALASGSAETISLATSGLPSGVTAGFSPASVTTGGASSLTFNVAGSVAPGTYTITVLGTSPSTSHSTSVSLTVTALSGLPSPWADTDVGAPSPAGSATFNAGVFSVTGSGADIYGANDQFNYVFQPSTGNGTLIARVISQSNTGSSNSKAGIIWKASTTSGSPYILIETGPTGAVKVQYNFNGSVTGATYSFPNLWMKLVRSGGNFSAYLSPDGSTWTAILLNKSLPTITTSATVGLFECSHKPGTLGTATFDNVSFTPGP
jgi:glucose/arabinose dehydrogenase/regulation of enolase protein 1 (concanavalin A-like superfamily)